MPTSPIDYAAPWLAPPTEPVRHYVGLDLGQAQDYTAAVVLEWRPLPAPEPILSQAQRLGIAPPPPAPAPEHAGHVVHLERLRNVSYVAQVRRVGELLAALRDRRPLRRDPLTRREVPPPPIELVLDRTGVGRAVYDQFAAADLPGARLTGVTITAGEHAHPSPDGGAGWNVPKRDLVGVVAVALQARALKVAPALPLATTLQEELKGFKVTWTAGGHARYGAGGDALSWRESPHDDLVLAVALALWWAETSSSTGGWDRIAEQLRRSFDYSSGAPGKDGPWR